VVGEAAVYARPVRVNVVRRGSGDPIVFLHGLGTSAASWAAVAEALADRYETLAVDLIGHGESAVPDDAGEYRRDRVLADIDEVCALVDRRPLLVGHSLGGYLALAYAATRPGAVRGLVVVNTGPGYRDDVKREEWNARSRRNAHRFGVPPQVADLNLQDDAVVIERLPDIDAPTLALAGGDDRPEYATSGAYLERKMPDARFRVVDGGGHSMHESSHADEVATLIADFATSLPAR